MTSEKPATFHRFYLDGIEMIRAEDYRRDMAQVIDVCKRMDDAAFQVICANNFEEAKLSIRLLNTVHLHAKEMLAKYETTEGE